MNKRHPATSRRLLRFSLRTLFIALLLVGVGMGWFVAKLRQARQQRAAVAAIRSNYGGVEYDFGGRLESWADSVLYVPSPGPRWSRDLLGDDFFSSVVAVSFNQSAKVLTDNDLQPIERLPELVKLIISEGQITDAGLMHLRGLTGLRDLWLHNMPLTGVGLVHVVQCRDLDWLSLDGSQICSDSLILLKQFPRLRALSLDGTRIDDSGAEHLAALASLEILQIRQTRLTDDAIRHLKKLHRLKYLYARGTSITKAGKRELQTGLPNCSISLGPAWCLDKPALRAALDAELIRRDSWQGKRAGGE